MTQHNLCRQMNTTMISTQSGLKYQNQNWSCSTPYVQMFGYWKCIFLHHTAKKHAEKWRAHISPRLKENIAWDRATHKASNTKLLAPAPSRQVHLNRNATLAKCFCSKHRGLNAAKFSKSGLLILWQLGLHPNSNLSHKPHQRALGDLPEVCEYQCSNTLP